jgi:cysteine synthase B
MLGAALGFPVRLMLPANASPERVQILRAYGAQLTLSDPVAGTDGARQLARELAAAGPDRYFHADQYNNPANPPAHYTTTLGGVAAAIAPSRQPAPEILGRLSQTPRFTGGL